MTLARGVDRRRKAAMLFSCRSLQHRSGCVVRCSQFAVAARLRQPDQSLRLGRSSRFCRSPLLARACRSGSPAPSTPLAPWHRLDRRAWSGWRVRTQVGGRSGGCVARCNGAHLVRCTTTTQPLSNYAGGHANISGHGRQHDKQHSRIKPSTRPFRSDRPSRCRHWRIPWSRARDGDGVCRAWCRRRDRQPQA